MDDAKLREEISEYLQDPVNSYSMMVSILANSGARELGIEIVLTIFSSYIGMGVGSVDIDNQDEWEELLDSVLDQVRKIALEYRNSGEEDPSTGSAPINTMN